MKTLVTGGNGFIGSNLVRELVTEGRDIVVASDFFRSGLENLLRLGIKKSDIEIRNTDLTHYSQALMAVEGVESVFHLAARVGSLEYLHGTEKAELIALQENLSIDANIFRACQEQGVKKLVYASSVAVYSMSPQSNYNVIFRESDLDFSLDIAPFSPDGGYGWSKLIGELQLGWTTTLDIGIARLFNIFGINEPLETKKSHVIADLAQKILLQNDNVLEVYGNGKQSRDFLYVTDCAKALIKLEQKASSPPLTVNIGSGQAISIGDAARKLIELSGKNINIQFDSNRQPGPNSRTANIEKTKTLLGWKPEITFNEGLRLTCNWIKENSIH